jgi:hypothetical protein
MPEAVASWTVKYWRAPNERQRLYIRQEATLASRHGKEGGVIDWDALTNQWDVDRRGTCAGCAARVASATGKSRYGCRRGPDGVA